METWESIDPTTWRRPATDEELGQPGDTSTTVSRRYAGEYDQYTSSKSGRTEMAFELNGVEYESGIPSWFDLPEVWDTCTLGGVKVPGVVKVSGDASRKLDVKNPPGGAPTISDDGPEPAKIEISAMLWTRRHWAEAQIFINKFNPLSDKPGHNPCDINHPLLAMYGIRSVQIESMSVPVLNKDGALEMRIRVVQWFPPPKKPAKSKSTTPVSSEENTPENCLPFKNEVMEDETTRKEAIANMSKP